MNLTPLIIPLIGAITNLIAEYSKVNPIVNPIPSEDLLKMREALVEMQVKLASVVWRK